MSKLVWIYFSGYWQVSVGLDVFQSAFMGFSGFGSFSVGLDRL